MNFPTGVINPPRKGRKKTELSFLSYLPYLSLARGKLGGAHIVSFKLSKERSVNELFFKLNGTFKLQVTALSTVAFSSFLIALFSACWIVRHVHHYDNPCH